MDIQKAVQTMHVALSDPKYKRWYDGCCPGKGTGEHQGKNVVYVYATKKPDEFEQPPAEWEMVSKYFPVVLLVDDED